MRFWRVEAADVKKTELEATIKPGDVDDFVSNEGLTLGLKSKNELGVGLIGWA